VKIVWGVGKRAKTKAKATTNAKAIDQVVTSFGLHSTPAGWSRLRRGCFRRAEALRFRSECVGFGLELETTANAGGCRAMDGAPGQALRRMGHPPAGFTCKGVGASQLLTVRGLWRSRITSARIRPAGSPIRRPITPISIRFGPVGFCGSSGASITRKVK
jgi:hypothetical protein